ncbi:MAG: dynamin family protein [Verrucomicrobiales bacterium]|nr:dynamin family protein [Verrucomicrobiales bacterium]
MADDPTTSLGKNYFQTREKLSEAIDALDELGSEAAIDPKRLDLLKNLMASLEDPFLFVVVGEVNAGKSTLLNALFGQDFCKSDVIPTTDRIAFFKHGDEAHEFEFSEDITEVFRPNEFLRDFNIVDTPGTNSIEAEHQKITEQFLPMADLAIFVFSVTNPWGATTWDFLDRIHHQWKKKIIFVLQQCDLRTDEEVAAILEHLQKTAHHRFGQHFPTFAVSAKRAFLAKTSDTGNDELGEDSQILGLERYISGVVESSEARLVKLIKAWRASCFVLGEIKEKLGTASEIIRADTELLSELEPACRVQQERTLKKCEPLFEAFDQSFMAAGIQAEPLLDSEFRILSALLPKRSSAEEIEGLIFATTMKAVRRSVGAGANAVQEDVQHLWERVSEEMEQHFNLELSVGEEGSPDWTASHGRIQESVEDATAGVLRKLNLKDELGRLFARRSKAIWGFLFAAVISILGGVILSLLQINPWNAGAFGLGAVFLAFGAVVGAQSVKKTRAFYNGVIEEHRETVAETQRAAFADATGAFYKDFIQLFEPLRNVCRDHREKYEPQLELIQKTEKSLAELERILAPVEKALSTRKS